MHFGKINKSLNLNILFIFVLFAFNLCDKIYKLNFHKLKKA